MYSNIKMTNKIHIQLYLYVLLNNLVNKIPNNK